MLRFREESLFKWFNHSHRKPLILRGARQVGKTTLVNQFADNAGLTLHAVNLERHQTLSKAINALDIDAFLQDVQLITKKGSLNQPGALLFIDEIQAIPKAITLLRYLYEEKKNLAVVAAGSLLEFALADEGNTFSMPVGRIEYLFLGPLSFKEFLVASNNGHLASLLETYDLKNTFSVTAHQQLLALFKTYLTVGGMPEAVKRFIDTGDFQEVNKVHATILGTYREDFSKYARRSQFTKLQRVFDYLPVGIGKKVKYVNIDRHFKAVDLRQALQLLEMANVLTCAFCTDALTPPLAARKDLDIFKPYFLDCGLLNSISGITLVPAEIQNLFLSSGELAEQFIAQHLAYIAESYVKPALFYWLREGRSNNAEVDFLLQHHTGVVPIEVKSGTSGTLRSLQQFNSRAHSAAAIRFDLNEPSIQSLEAVAVDDANKKIVTRLISLPLYMVEEATRILNITA